MALRRRNRRVREPEARIGPDPDLDAETDHVAIAVLAAARAALHEPVELQVPPEPIYAGYGPRAHRVRLDTRHPEWSGPLVARTGPADVLVAEAGWTDTVRTRGFPAPRLVADGSDGVLVFREPAGVNLAERMVTDMASLPQLLADFGRLHAALHALPAPIAGVPGPDGNLVAPSGHRDPGRPPLVHATDDGDGAADDDRITAMAAWLAAHRPPTASPVICHGELTPVHVVLAGDEKPGDGDADASPGGNGDDGHRDTRAAGAVVVNWMGAGVADAELDVAATLTGFWSTPLYVDSAVQRRVLRMVRDSLGSSYQAAYLEAADRPLDDDRLVYWQASHLCRIAVGVARCAARGPCGPWDTAAHVVQPDAALDEIERRFRDLTGG